MSRIVRKWDYCLAKTMVQISCAVTAQLISTFIFATRIVQLLLFLNPEFQASSLFLRLYKACLYRIWLETPKTGFLALWLIWNVILTRWNASKKGFKGKIAPPPRKDFAMFLKIQIIGSSEGLLGNSTGMIIFMGACKVLAYYIAD